MFLPNNLELLTEQPSWVGHRFENAETRRTNQTFINRFVCFWHNDQVHPDLKETEAHCVFNGHLWDPTYGFAFNFRECKEKRVERLRLRFGRGGIEKRPIIEKF
jgi:hypothetical protein